MYINSYHSGYPWSDGITSGIVSALIGTGIELDTVEMDTKRHTDEEFMIKSGLRAKQIIDDSGPDLIIAPDDNASKYVIEPFFKNTGIPVVFCGVNWDASGYGFPCRNVTGMIEISPVDRLVRIMEIYARGKRVGLLGADNISNRKEAVYYKTQLNVVLAREVFVSTYEEWKDAFVALQDEVDMIIMAPPSFVAELQSQEEAINFIKENTTIPTGCVEEWIVAYSLLGLTKVAEEQGQWAAGAALKILDGARPSDVPVARNKMGQLMWNLSIAEKLDILIKPYMLKGAIIIE